MTEKINTLAIIHLEDRYGRVWDCVARSTVSVYELQKIVDDIKKEFDVLYPDWTLHDICRELYDGEVLYPVKDEVEFINIRIN